MIEEMAVEDEKKWYSGNIEIVLIEREVKH